MTNTALNMNDTELLNVPINEPERVFPRDKSGIKKIYKKLAQKWHPDHSSNTNAAMIFAHVSALKISAEEKLNSGTWHVPGLLEIKQASGKTAKIQYLKMHVFELGEFYISKDSITYVVRAAYKDLFNNALRNMQNFKYKDDNMRRGLSLYLPKMRGQFTAKNGDKILVIERDPNTILLRDYLQDVESKMEPKHAAWVINRLHNMTAYLQWAGLVHNGMSIDTCFILPKDHDFKRTASKPIAPKDHSIFVAGGWWYTTKNNAPLIGLPAQATQYAPHGVLDSGRADRRIDHTMIRVIGRSILGDPSGIKLARDPDVPKPMTSWLTLPGSGDAFKDFETWEKKVEKECFGVRRFVELNINPSDIYKPLKP